MPRALRIAVVVVLVLLGWVRVASALDLEKLRGQARERVVHVSVRDGKGEEVSSGSGFVITAGGRVVTNFHVIDQASTVVAVFADNRQVPVTGVWAFDQQVDLAVLQLEPGKYLPLTLAAEPAREGEDIVVLGSPLGLGHSISAGIVSAMREGGIEKARHREARASWNLQITAAAAPGSSGSPILRANGDVVGVMVGSARGMDGVHFGIAVAKLNDLLAAAPAQPQALNSATGVRSVKTNLLISGAVLAGTVLLWILGARLLGKSSPPAGTKAARK